MRVPALVTILALSLSPAFAGENWPEFRGPNGDGKSDATGLPVSLAEKENLKWKTPIHGEGFSSPVVWGDQIWLTTATPDGKKMYAVCVNKNDGTIVYDILLFENEDPRFKHALNSYASPTPAIEEGRVYVHFGSYGTACLDTKTGQTLWQRRDLVSDDFRGPGSSPILHGGLLIVAYDGFDYQFIVAFDKTTGETAWKRDRDIDYGSDNGDYKKAYSTAAVIEHNGRTELISPSAVDTIAYDPKSGEELWRVRLGGMNAAGRTVFGHGLLYINPGDGGAEKNTLKLAAVRPGGTGDVTDTHIAWDESKSIPKRGSPILHGELLFLVDDSGVASCRVANTGELIWQERLGGEFWSSPLFAEGRIYACSKDGDIFVFAADREFKLIAENRLDSGCNAAPAVSGKSLILRTFTDLYCFEEQ